MMVADTDVLIDFLEGRAPAADRVALELDRGQLRTTVISRSSSWRARRPVRSRGSLVTCWRPCRVCPWTTLRPTEPPRSDAISNARAWASAWRTV